MAAMFTLLTYQMLMICSHSILDIQ